MREADQDPPRDPPRDPQRVLPAVSSRPHGPGSVPQTSLGQTRDRDRQDASRLICDCCLAGDPALRELHCRRRLASHSPSRPSSSPLRSHSLGPKSPADNLSPVLSDKFRLLEPMGPVYPREPAQPAVSASVCFVAQAPSAAPARPQLTSAFSGPGPTGLAREGGGRGRQGPGGCTCAALADVSLYPSTDGRDGRSGGGGETSVVGVVLVGIGPGVALEAVGGEGGGRRLDGAFKARILASVQASGPAAAHVPW